MCEQKMERNTAGLRNVLLDEIESLRAGKTSEGRAHAIARLANATVATVRLEIDHYGLTKGDQRAVKPLALVA